MIAGATRIFHQFEQRVNDVIDPPQIRLVVMCTATRIASELVYQNSLVWSANAQNCNKYFQRIQGKTPEAGACYMVEFLVHPEVSVPLILSGLLLGFAGRQVFNIVHDVVEFRPQNMTLLEMTLLLGAIAAEWGY